MSRHPFPRPHHPRRRAGATVLAATALLGLTAAGASAHVEVKPDSTAAGSYAELVFTVPNEEPAARTTKISVTLPQTAPFTDVSVRPLAGWTVTVADAALPTPATVDGTSITKAPHVVTWTATGDAAIAPGEYQSFAISAGPLPAAGTVELPALQTYSDGTVVAWTDASTEGAAEPAHPAPHFAVTAAAADGSHATGGANAAQATAAPGSTAAGSSDPTSRWLSGAALVVALGAAGLQLAGRRRVVG